MSVTGFNYEQKLAGIMTELYDGLWQVRGYDSRLKRAMAACLDTLRVPGFEAKGFICRYDGREAIWLFRSRYEQEGQEWARQVLGRLSGLAGTSGTLLVADSTWCVFHDIKEAGRDSASAVPAAVHFGALIYKTKLKQGDPEFNRWNILNQEAIIPMLFEAFRHREMGMMPFAAGLSRHYWQLAPVYAEKGQVIPFGQAPPWECGSEEQGSIRRTVTVSLDLRKSTFCMAQAESQSEFGMWLDQLVQEVIRCCHQYGGVFDKFTGDGGLMHFLPEESQAVFHRDAITLAVQFAFDLRDRIEGLLPKLRRNLRNDSGLLGGGIGVGMSTAFWSVDHRRNPMVVGNGVVDACRICDTAPARSIRLSNYAYRELKDVDGGLANRFRQITLPETKDLPPTLKIQAWECAD